MPAFKVILKLELIPVDHQDICGVSGSMSETIEEVTAAELAQGVPFWIQNRLGQLAAGGLTRAAAPIKAWEDAACAQPKGG